MKAKTIYLLLFLAAVYINIMYPGDFPPVLLGFLFILPIVLWVQASIFKRRLDSSISLPPEIITRGESLNINIHLKNRSLLPILNIKLLLQLENRYTMEVQVLRPETPIAAKSELVLSCKSMAPNCGVLACRIKHIEVWDYLGMWKRIRRIHCSDECIVFPKIQDMDIQLSERTRSFFIDSDEYDKHTAGDDPSEVFGIREFRPGDSMTRIHWKMSAKSDDMMVKEFSRPVGCSLLIILDPAESERSPQGLNHFAEAAASISYTLMSKECSHLFGWYDYKEKRLQYFRVMGLEDIYELIQRLLHWCWYRGEKEERITREYLESAYSPDKYSGMLYLNMDMQLYLNKELLCQFSKTESVDWLKIKLII